jgi:hypothetical protein
MVTWFVHRPPKARDQSISRRRLAPKQFCGGGDYIAVVFRAWLEQKFGQAGPPRQANIFRLFVMPNTPNRTRLP